MFEQFKSLPFDDKATVLFTTCLACVFLLIVGFFFGAFMAHESGCSQAIKAGVAEYQLDKTTGEVTFQYVKPNH